MVKYFIAPTPFINTFLPFLFQRDTKKKGFNPFFPLRELSSLCACPRELSNIVFINKKNIKVKDSQ